MNRTGAADRLDITLPRTDSTGMFATTPDLLAGPTKKSVPKSDVSGADVPDWRFEVFPGIGECYNSSILSIIPVKSRLSRINV